MVAECNVIDDRRGRQLLPSSTDAPVLYRDKIDEAVGGDPAFA